MAASLDFDRYPRARGVFHEVLLAHLNEQGASTADELEARELEWFYLPFERQEIAEIVESARRHGLVAPLGQTVDGHNRRVQGIEWAPTQRGAELKRPPAVVSRGDMLSSLRSWPRLLQQASGLIALVVGAATLKRMTDQGVVRLGLAGAVGIVVLLLLLVSSRRNYGRLRQAALAWSRLQRDRPKFYAWQTARWRFWARLGAWLLILASVGLGFANVIGSAAMGVGMLAGATLLGALRMARYDEYDTAEEILTSYAESQKRLAAGRPD